jgi:hypothetical protein
MAMYGEKIENFLWDIVKFLTANINIVTLMWLIACLCVLASYL